MSRKLPPNVCLAIRELCRPYLPDLPEADIAERLTAPPASAPVAGPLDRLRTVPETARYLGVCRATVGNMLRDGELTRIKVRRSCRIRQSEIEALAAGRKIARAGE